MNRLLRVTLVFSIAFNVLLAGMLSGEMSHRLISPPQAFDITSELAKLPPEKRVMFETFMSGAKQQTDADHASMDSAKKEALRLLTVEPFNKDAYLAQVGRIDNLHRQMKQKLAQAVVNLAQQLNSDERNVLMQIISHPPFSLPPMAPNPVKPITATP